MNQDVNQLILNAANWDHPSLSAFCTSHMSDAKQFVAYLRQRATPSTGYSHAYVQEVRHLAKDADRQDARKRLAAALDQSIVDGSHGNPIIRVGAESLILAMDAEAAGRMAENVLASRAKWAQPTWGKTRGICDLLRVLIAIPEVPDESIVPLIGWLLEQLPAEWVVAKRWTETRLGSSGHNWCLHTYIGFWMAGLLFPEFRVFEKFSALAPVYFEHEMQLLMYPDGFTRERSGYHWGTVQHFLDIILLARANRIQFSPKFYDHLQRLGETLWKMLAPDGDIPRFGDTAAFHEPDKGIARLRIATALLGMPEGKAVAEALQPDLNAPLPGIKPGDHGELASWQDRVNIPGLLPAGGRNLIDDYCKLSQTLPPIDSTLPDSGYYLIRQNWTRDADWTAIDAGHIGSVVASHAHTAMLNFELYSRGRPILVDNSCGSYGDDPARDWRNSSPSHNVLTIDKKDQVHSLTQWRWDRECTPFVNEFRSEPAYAYFSGAHEAYRHLPEPVTTVRRKLFYLRGEYWILIDRVTADTDAEHDFDLHFQVMPPASLNEDGSVQTSGDGGNLLILPVTGARGKATLEPCPYPLEGYDNPLHLVYRQTGSNRSLFVTVLIPFTGALPHAKVQLTPVRADDRDLVPWDATGLTIELGNRTDHYVDWHTSWHLPWEAGPYGGQQRLFHSRVRG